MDLAEERPQMTLIHCSQHRFTALTKLAQAMTSTEHLHGCELNNIGTHNVK